MEYDQYYVLITYNILHSDLKKIEETRQNIPILSQRRTDLYDILYHHL